MSPRKNRQMKMHKRIVSQDHVHFFHTPYFLLTTLVVLLILNWYEILYSQTYCKQSSKGVAASEKNSFTSWWLTKVTLQTNHQWLAKTLRTNLQLTFEIVEVINCLTPSKSPYWKATVRYVSQVLFFLVSIKLVKVKIGEFLNTKLSFIRCSFPSTSQLQHIRRNDYKILDQAHADVFLCYFTGTIICILGISCLPFCEMYLPWYKLSWLDITLSQNLTGNVDWRRHARSTEVPPGKSQAQLRRFEFSHHLQSHCSLATSPLQFFNQMIIFPAKSRCLDQCGLFFSHHSITEDLVLFDSLSMRFYGSPKSSDEIVRIIWVITLAVHYNYTLLHYHFMGASQICINTAVGREEDIQKEHPHAPNPEIYPEVGDYPASLSCGINHVRQQLASRKLQPPPDYCPSPYRKDSFFELVKDTAYYRGEWCNGEPEGQGEVIFRDRSYFRGFFKEMQASGPECLFVLSDGAYYLGAVAHSKRVGHGQFIDHGYCYDGEWLNNLPHGKGRETFPNVDFFQGRFLQGLRSGSGIYNWASGPYLRFQGHFDGNMFGQKGILITREGAEVQGQFNCGQQFDIAPCTIKTPKLLVKNCIVNDGSIESLLFQKRNFVKTQQGTTLKRKKLIHCSEIDERIICNIIEAIEAGYRKASKHNEALEQIRKSLSEYSFEWWNDGQAKNGLLIAEICGKKVQVSKK